MKEKVDVSRQGVDFIGAWVFWYFFLCFFCSFRVRKAISRGGGYKLKLWLVSPLNGVVPLPNGLNGL